ncbi:MAG: hypothetical protein A3E83_07105 [Gammaproteobacteria bacterium RIFCSPHIGHO2_12_FULL_41_20]|nr:MAG: hypothetical protein A3E83_07105 [Gammaproteobacteria bacterium RIFCSPHIGHO2_12_FULL_41_20]
MPDTLDESSVKNNMVAESLPNREAVSRGNPKRRGTAMWGKFFLAGILLALVLVSGYSGYQAWRINAVLTNAIESLHEQMEQQQGDIASAQDAVAEVQQALKNVNQTVAQQGQQFQEWRTEHSQGGWKIAEAQYLVKMAHDQLQFMHNIPLAITLLQAASQTIQQLNDANLAPILQALNTDLIALQQLPIVDVSAVYSRLLRVNKALDILPLTVAVPSAAPQVIPAVTSIEALPWWRAAAMNTWRSLQQVVKVHYTPGNTLPFILPEQQHYLYQNLHAQLENAMWAALHYEESIYQASLEQTHMWVRQYFVQDAEVTKNTLAELAALQAIHLQSPLLTLSALPAFQAYFAQNGNT